MTNPQVILKKCCIDSCSANGVETATSVNGKSATIFVCAVHRSRFELIKKEPKASEIPAGMLFECPKCGSKSPIKRTLTRPKETLYILECGHLISVKDIKQQITDSEWSFGNLSLYPFQREGVAFIEQSKYNTILADEMGVGKTIQAIVTLRRNFKNLTPCLIIVPAGLIYNWQRELKIWLLSHPELKGDSDYAPLVHTNSWGNFLDGQKIHIVSNAIIGANSEFINEVKDFGFKYLIVDEAHQFKNDGSARTQALLKIAAIIPHKLLMSGTSVLNRVSEYFNSLHMVQPGQWPRIEYLNSYCAFDAKGKILGIANNKREAFFERTKGYIIRRKKKDVLKDMPAKHIMTEFMTVTGNKNFVNEYNAQLDELENAINQNKQGALDQTSMIGIMAKLRHTVGLAKVRPLAERVRYFLENTENNEKITVGTHHRDVQEFLAKELSEFKPILMSDEPARRKDELEQVFRSDLSRRLAIVSIVGCGTGRNLQFCDNAILGERQWNPSIENQFIDRFHRIGSNDPKFISVPVVAQTIDEYFNDMVSLKGELTASVLDQDVQTDHFTMMQLAEKMVSSRLKYVG